MLVDLIDMENKALKQSISLCHGKANLSFFSTFFLFTCPPLPLPWRGLRAQERTRSLKATLEREWEMSATERRRLESELEEVLDDLSALQEKELKEERQLQLLQDCNHELQSQLDQAKGQLHRSEVMMRLWRLLQGACRCLKCL